MKIIRAKEGESIYEIAAECGIAPQLLGEISGIEGRYLREGREIGSYTPSRCYTVRSGDTLRSVAERFRVDEGELVRLNPELTGGGLYRGQYILIGLCEGKVGVGAVNGNLYRGCGVGRLKSVLPYLNTLSVAAARARGKEIRLDGSMLGSVGLARGAGVSPLLRIYIDGMPEGEREEFLIGAVMLARSHGFRGIVLGGIAALGRSACELVMQARRRMIDEGLTLGVEGEIGGGAEYTEYADFSILTYDKLHLSEIPSLADGERAAVEEHAEKYEVAGAMLDLPAFALSRGGYVSRESAIYAADRRGGSFEHVDGAGYMRLSRGRFSAVCESMENTHERINVAAECGMLGVSFDVARLPFGEIYMTGAMLHKPSNLPEIEEPILNCRGEKKESEVKDEE